MGEFEFSVKGPPADLDRGLRRIDPSRAAPKLASKPVLWASAAVVIVLYSTNTPGDFTIATNAVGDETTERFIEVTGTVQNPLVQWVQLQTNGSFQSASVNGGKFFSKVPLMPGVNTIRASVGGVAANVASGSNVTAVTAKITPAGVWSALTWGGPGDIDLHLVLPDGQHCFFKTPNVGGAKLDIDNRTADGPEHIVMEKATPGQYRMLVNYFAANGPERPVRWSVDLQLRGGKEHHTYSGVLVHVDEFQDVAVFSFP